ncbi:conserved hypothetical protein [Treponema phagedenis]|uniref:HEPN domain-containing protein n=1 Tax=Treponema phagedenis TaxID=162 RepID=A0A0B7GYD4_TREPH|nr:hypothetical protein [Treponema phagedenis]CEM61666.1 conserved hypothetical protein [Treponema phagedenis]
MSFQQKINERIAQECKKLKAFNVGASRAYYCAFLKAKDYLIANGISKQKYKQMVKNKKERAYSHGSIQKVLYTVKSTKNNKIDWSTLFLCWDNLYKQRIVADYDEQLITEDNFDKILSDLQFVLAIF